MIAGRKTQKCTNFLDIQGKNDVFCLFLRIRGRVPFQETSEMTNQIQVTISIDAGL
jgi:hypothetical protein